MSIWTHFTTETTCVAFDTETNGLFRQGKNNPRMVQLAWSIFSIDRGDIKKQSHLIRADDFDPNPSGNLKHGIDRARSLREGIPPLEALERFRQDVIANGVKILVGHNIEFDIMVLKSECLVVRHNLSDVLGLPQFCTMKEMTGVLQIQNDRNKHRYEARVSAYEESLDLRTRGAKRSLARFEAYLSKELLTNKFKYPSLSEFNTVQLRF